MGRAFEFRKARKMKRWAGMAVTFTRIGKDISMAVKEGGPDPTTNSRLRVAIQNAKTANMPKDNVERAIQKALSKEMENVKEIVYEGYGPHKVAIVVETTTDNHNRTVANIRSYFNKCGGSLGTTGSLDFLFDRKSMFKIKRTDAMNLEDLELELIDFGLDEIFEEDDNIVIYAGVSDFGQMQKAIEERHFEIVSAEFERIPTDSKQLTDEQVLEVEKLLDKLEEDEDVVKVFHNMG